MPSAGSQYSSAFVCVTAYVKVKAVTQVTQRGGPLPTVIDAVHAWLIPRITLTVITQDGRAAAALRVALDQNLKYRWENTSRELRVMFPERGVPSSQLAWQHRDLMKAELSSFDLFGYLEHDMLLQWEQVDAWAHDEALLATVPPPEGGLPWRRGFYRWYTRFSLPAAAARPSSPPHAGAIPKRFLSDGNPCKAGMHGSSFLSMSLCRVSVSGRAFLCRTPARGSWAALD